MWCHQELCASSYGWWHEEFVYAWVGIDNGENIFFCMWCPLGMSVGRDEGFFMFLMIICTTTLCEPAKYMLGCSVLPEGCGLQRWSCCIGVLVNKWNLLYSWVGGGTGSEIVSYSQWVFFFCKALSCVFQIQKSRFTHLSKKLWSITLRKQ